MATVYLATDLRHERKVALKVLKPELAATMGPERFLQEVRVTANLQHPHCEAQGERTAACARAVYRTGEIGLARTRFEELLAQDPENTTLLGWAGSAAALEGDREAALAISERLAEIEARSYVYGGPTSWRAAIAAELGDRDEAVALLQESYRQGYGL